MGKYSRTLKTLRTIALDYGRVAYPDLASMARELGRVVHLDSATLVQRLAPRRARQRGFGQWMLAERGKPALRVQLGAWPANHRMPVQQHDEQWQLTLVLNGALEVQSLTRDPASGDLRMRGRDWLGPGDCHWFESEPGQLHQQRNLSRHDTALTLHVCGGQLTPRTFAVHDEASAARSAKALLAGIAAQPIG
jgi:hypothetical protein